MLLSFPLGQLSNIPLPFVDAKIYYHDILILIYIICNSKNMLPLIKKYPYFIGFASISFLSLSINSASFSLTISQLLVSAAYLIRYLTYIIFGLLIINYQQSKKSKITIKTYIYFSFSISLLLGFIQFIFMPNLEWLFPLGWDRHLYRLAGPWLDANFTGLIYSLFFNWLLFQTKFSKKPNYFQYFLLFTSLIAIFLTYSRSTYLSLIVTLLILAIQKAKIRPFIFGILSLFLLIPFLPMKFGESTKLLRTSTIKSRLVNYQQSAELIENKPLFGYGFNTLRYTNTKHQTPNTKYNPRSNSASGLDNSLLFTFAVVGTLGSVFFFLMWKEILSPYLANPFILSSIILITVHGMFQLSWFYPWVIILFFVFLAQQPPKIGINRKDL